MEPLSNMFEQIKSNDQTKEGQTSSNGFDFMNIMKDANKTSQVKSDSSKSQLPGLILDDSVQEQRWQIMKETQVQIFKVMQDVTSDRTRTPNKDMNSFDSYIRS